MHRSASWRSVAFLGDCLLWAGGWLGPDRLRALEVEPNVAATARLADSLAQAGLARSVHVVSETLGDGASHWVDAKAPDRANPNFGLCPRRNASCAATSASARCSLRRLSTLDEVVAKWLARAPAARPIDLLRVKAGHSVALILRGMRAHLQAGRVRRLLLEAPPRLALEVGTFMRQFAPYVRLRGRHLRKVTFPPPEGLTLGVGARDSEEHLTIAPILGSIVAGNSADQTHATKVEIEPWPRDHLVYVLRSAAGE